MVPTSTVLAVIADSYAFYGKTFQKCFFLIGIHSMQSEQPLPGMELQEKEAQKDQRIQEISLERTYS